MRKTLTLLATLLLSNSVLAQQLQPVPANKYRPKKNLPGISTKVGDLLKQKSVLESKAAEFNIKVLSGSAKFTDSNQFNSLAVESIGIDSQISDYQDALDEVDLDAFVKQNNAGANTFITGLGGISDLQNPKGINGNFAISATMRLGKFRRLGSKWVDPSYLYMAFNTKTHSTEDSSDLSKSVLFPEIGKRDFVIGTYWQFQRPQDNWILQPVVEFSLNKYDYKKDSTTKGFLRTESLMIGLKIMKTGLFSNAADSTNLPSGFQIFPYYALVTVQPKNFDSYNEAFAHTVAAGSELHLAPTWHCFGLQAIFQVSSVMMFANMRYVLNADNSKTPENLRGFTYTVGTIIGVDFLKFRL